MAATKSVLKKITSAAAGLALAAGALTAVAPAATAAPGDSTDFPTGAQPAGLAQDAGGNLWVANEAGTISRVPLGEPIASFATGNSRPLMIAAGSDGNMWFTDRLGILQVGRVAPDGSVAQFAAGAQSALYDIALGPDGNMWFTVPIEKRIGRITPSGDVTLFDSGDDFLWITPGPTGSNRMYLGGNINKLGYITMDGAVTSIDGPTNGLNFADLQLIDNQVWFTVRTSRTTSTLGRLVRDSEFVLLANPSIVNPDQIGVGVGGTMWVSDLDGQRLHHVTTSGDLAATYNVGIDTRGLVQAQDGNVWMTIEGGDGVKRVLTGVVPTSSTAPVLDKTTDLVAGTVINVSNGAWAYRPTSYAYQWQLCTGGTAATCSDIAGATSPSFTLPAADVGKYLRAGVTAVNLNGASNPAYTAIVGTGATPTPEPEPTPQPNPNPNPTPQPLGPTASIGGGVTMVIDAPARQKRNKRKMYEVTFSSPTVQGTMVFEFKKGSRITTKTVAVEDGLAEYRWKAPRKWRKGRTTVSATFIPAAGTSYQSAEVIDRVRIT